MEDVGVRTEAVLLGKQYARRTWSEKSRATDATMSPHAGSPVAWARPAGLDVRWINHDSSARTLWRIPEEDGREFVWRRSRGPLEKLAHAAADELLMDAGAPTMNPGSVTWRRGRLVGWSPPRQFRQALECDEDV